MCLASLSCDLQLTLGQFATKCETTSPRISTAKSEPMVLSQKRMDGPLWVGDDSLSQMEELQYLGILLMSGERMEPEIDKWIGSVSAMMQILYWSVVVKRELNQKRKLLICWSISVPTITYGHELWVVTERTRSQIQLVEISFHQRVSMLTL